MFTHTNPRLTCHKQLATRLKQVRQRCQYVDPASDLGQATQPGLLKAEMLLDHPEWVLTFGSDVGLGRFDQIL